METNQFKVLEESERIKKLKEKYCDEEAFFSHFSPAAQISASDRERAILDDYPTIKDMCIAYGKDAAARWLICQLSDLVLFAGAESLTDMQQMELASVIATEYDSLKVTEIMHFFYRVKSGQYIHSQAEMTPLNIMFHLQRFMSERNALIWFNALHRLKKVFLIVEDHPKTKVYARVFRTKKDAEKALEERDYRTGEKLYPACHIIERQIE